MEWITPKTDWTYDDYFNVSDYNRIKNNLLYICEKIGYVTSLLTIDYSYIPDTNFFHNISSLTNILYQIITGSNASIRTDFYENDIAWTADDVNVIEGLILTMYRTIETMDKIPFVLGGVKY